MKKLFFLVVFFSSLYADTNKYESSTVGIELNPLRVFDNTLSGTFSYFNNENAWEIAVPFFYSQYEVERSSDLGKEYNYSERDLDIDLHYRKYLSKTVNGTYLGLFGRYTYIDGKLKHEPRMAELHKFGLGAEVGYRVMNLFGYNKFYWGASFALGKYFSSNNEIFDSYMISTDIDDLKIFFDVELLKIGYKF